MPGRPPSVFVSARRRWGWPDEGSWGRAGRGSDSAALFQQAGCWNLQRASHVLFRSHFVSPAVSEAETMARVRRGARKQGGGGAGEERRFAFRSRRRRRGQSALPGSLPLLGLIKKLFSVCFFMLIELKEQSCVRLSGRGRSSERVPVPTVTPERVHPGLGIPFTHTHTATEATVGPDPSICSFTRLFIRPSFPSSCHPFVRPSPFICCYYQAGEKKV